MSMAAFDRAISDRYRMEHEIGRGGMATVYVADDLKHRRKVAIKVMHAELAAVVDHLHRIQDEYLRYGREYLGWAMHVLNPVEF